MNDSADVTPPARMTPRGRFAKWLPAAQRVASGGAAAGPVDRDPGGAARSLVPKRVFPTAFAAVGRGVF